MQRARRRAAQRALSEHAGEMALVIDRATTVGARRTVLGRDLARLREQLVRRRLAAQELLSAVEVYGRHPDRAQGDAGVGDRASIDPHSRRSRGNGPVAGATLHLLVRAAHTWA